VAQRGVRSRRDRGAVVALIVRDGTPVASTANTALRHGDDVLVVVPRRSRAEVEARLKSISVYGRLAGWLDRPIVHRH